MAWLKDLRDASSLSQEEAAQAVGVDKREIRRWENEHAPGSVKLLQLLGAYGVELSVPPPTAIPLAVNAELRAVRLLLEDLRRESLAHAGDEDGGEAAFDDLVSRLQAPPPGVAGVGGALPDPLDARLRELREEVSSTRRLVAEALGLQERERELEAELQQLQADRPRADEGDG